MAVKGYAGTTSGGGGGGGAAQTITTGITAAGTTLATATQLTAQQNIVTTTPSGTGVALPLSPASGQVVTTKNYGANTLLLYPNTALVAIGDSAAGVPISLPVLASVTLAFDGTQWW
jgi:hypothetical protein